MNVLETLGQPWITLLVMAAVIAAIVTIIKAPGILWEHVLMPLSRSVVEVNTIQELNEVAPDLIKLSKMAGVLDEIARQFKTDSGSSLRDVINTLERLVKENTIAVEAIKRGQAAPQVLEVAKIEAKTIAAAAATEVLAVAAAAAARLMAIAEATEKRKV